LLVSHGGRDKLEQTCAEHLRHEKQNWRPFARQAFVPLRALLLRLADMLPLQATTTTVDLLDLIAAVADDEPSHCHVAPDVLPREWRGLV
jgi:hypothetical protein